MPTLYPTAPTSDISDYHERLVVEKLMATLPDQCLIFHGFETLTWKQLNDRSSTRVVREKEIDVIVFWPSKGLIVLEVKGGEISHKDGKWKSFNREGSHEGQDPFAQARENLHNVINRITEVTGLKEKELGIARAYAAVFPESCYEGDVPDDEKLPANAKKAILCDSRNFEDLDRFIAKAFVAFSGRNEAHSDAIKANVVKDILLPEFKLVRCLSSRIARESEEFLRLTYSQSVILDMLAERKRVSIPGSAGSGKTLLAAEQAKRFAQQGMRTLVLCFNEALSDWLVKLTEGEMKGRIEVFNFHKLCEEVTLKAGGEFIVPEDKKERTKYYNDVAPELLREYAKISGHVYDAVIVDEGQDFRENWWIALDSCMNEDSRLFVFYDAQQDVFKAMGLGALDLLDVDSYPLSQNCRNTKAIAKFCEEHTGVSAVLPIDAPEGQPVVVEVRKETFERRSIAIDTLRDWLINHRLKPSQILIVSPFRAKKTCLSDVNEVGGVPIVTSIDEWENNEGILIATGRAIKGLEASVVLLVDAVQPGSHPVFTPTDFYVACTRAQNQLRVIALEKLEPEYKAVA